MNTRNLALCAAIAASVLFISGCREKFPASSPACVEMKETKDLARKAELEKYCPLGGEYKPSPVVNW